MPINLIDRVHPKNDGNFPMCLDDHLYGGWRVVADIAARDAITAERRREGMQVKVLSNDKTYELKGGITNGDWVEVVADAGEVSGVAKVTAEDFTIPVDYDDGGGGSVGDPPAGTVFTSQAEVDDFLTAQGWTAIKHVQAALDAVPTVLNHHVTVECAAGVHRPPPGASLLAQAAGKLRGGGLLYITGALGSEYDEVVASATITAVGADPHDPYVDFTGTPFPADRSLRGLYVVLDTGQVNLIHDHTTSRLYLMKEVSPVPASGFVGRQSTHFRNSWDDVAPAGWGCLTVRGYNMPQLEVQDLLFNSFGRPKTNVYNGSSAVYTRCLIDDAYERDQFGTNPNYRGWEVEGGCLMYHIETSARGSKLAASPMSGSDEPISSIGGANVIRLWASYYGGWQDPILFASGELMIEDVVIDESDTFGIDMAAHARLQLTDRYYTAKKNLIRDCVGGGIRLRANAVLEDYSFYSSSWRQICTFEGNTGPCLVVEDHVSLSLRSIEGLKDGGGNLDVGIEFTGFNSSVALSDTTDVSGANGDVKMAGGEIHSWADIQSLGPYVDINGNRVSKERP